MRAKKQSTDEWMTIITEARQSGLSDKDWCQKNGISVHTFYNAVKRLRKKACELPERISSGDRSVLPEKQEVVRVELVPDDIPDKPAEPPMEAPHLEYLDNPHTMIELQFNGAVIRVANGADPMLLAKTIRMIGGL